MAGTRNEGVDQEMIASNVARSREANCVECGAKIDGGRYCDACLPANQTELEEQFDREHPVASGGPVDADDDAGSKKLDHVVCPKCNREVRPKNADDKIRAALYSHFYSQHLRSFGTRRDMLQLLDELAPSDSPELPDDAEWEHALKDIGKAILHNTEEDVRRVEKSPSGDGPAQAAVKSQESTAHCPLSGCSWVSSPGEPTTLKRRLYDHLFGSAAHAHISSQGRAAVLDREFPGVPWPRTVKKKRSEASAKVAKQVHSRPKEESRSTPVDVHRAVQQDSLTTAPVPALTTVGASSPLSAHQASSHKTLLLLDGTNGFSFAGCGAFLERTLKPFLESRALRVEITDTGDLLRMTMEMRKEEKA